MAELADEESGGEEIPRPGEPGYVEAIRKSLAATPHPGVAQDYHLEEATFWNHPHMPAGSVLEFKSSGIGEDLPTSSMALLVIGAEQDIEGMWLRVSVVGAENEELKKSMQSYFKGGRKKVHLCRLSRAGDCVIGGEEGLHIREFRWHPPGDFRATWLNAYGLKKVKEGPKMAMEEAGGAGERLPPPGTPRGAPLESDTEKRLAALRGRSPRVTFARQAKEIPGLPRKDRGQDGFRAGALRRTKASEAAVAGSQALEDAVKIEMVDLTARSRSPSRSPRHSRTSKESRLVEAATAHQKSQTKENKKRRERSRSRGRRRRSSKRRKSSSSSRSSRSQGSSSDSSLLPPLRRKSQRQPGSVFRLLEQQAYDFLAQDGVLEDRGPSSSHTSSWGSNPRWTLAAGTRKSWACCAGPWTCSRRASWTPCRTSWRPGLWPWRRQPGRDGLRPVIWSCSTARTRGRLQHTYCWRPKSMESK